MNYYIPFVSLLLLLWVEINQSHPSNIPLPGIIDLYDVGNWDHANLGGVGIFDCMSNVPGPRADGECGELSAFTKVFADWVIPIVITEDGDYVARSSNEIGDIFRIDSGFSEDEYLLIENRAQSGYDANMPGGGILIYHVDENIEKQKNPGFPGQEGWPQNGNHYKVALLQADGKYELEQLINNGDAGDYWVKDQSIGPSNGANIYPNTDSYQGGVIVPTNIRITILSDPGPTMKFRVEGLGGLTAPVSAPTAPSPVVTAQPTSTPVNVATSTNGVTAQLMPAIVTTSVPAPQASETSGFDSNYFMSVTLHPKNETSWKPSPSPTKFNKPTAKLELVDRPLNLDVVQHEVLVTGDSNASSTTPGSEVQGAKPTAEETANPTASLFNVTTTELEGASDSKGPSLSPGYMEKPSLSPSVTFSIQTGEPEQPTTSTPDAEEVTSSVSKRMFFVAQLALFLFNFSLCCLT